MITINDIRKRLNEAVIKHEAAEAIYDNREEVRLLQVDQLKHGLRKDGSKIGKYKNKAYAKKKFAQNPLAGEGNMDWILTGSLAKDIFIDVREDIFVIDSADTKTEKLIKDFGDPFGLSKESNKKLIVNDLMATFVSRMKEKLRL